MIVERGCGGGRGREEAVANWGLTCKNGEWKEHTLFLPNQAEELDAGDGLSKESPSKKMGAIRMNCEG